MTTPTHSSPALSSSSSSSSSDGGGRVEGVLSTIRWRSGSYVIGALADGTTVKGTLLAAQIGMQYEFTGEWVHHPKFGEQFQFTAARALIPTDPAAIRTYLRENVRGIGQTIASHLIRQYGGEALHVLRTDPERAAREIPKLGIKRAEEIQRFLVEHEEEQQVMIDLNSLLGPAEIGPAVRGRILESWGKDAPALIRENPFRLVDEIRGIGFLTADAIARGIGYPPEGTARIRAGVRHVLRDAASSGGHVCLPRPVLADRAAGLLGIGKAEIEDEVDAMLDEKPLGQLAVYSTDTDYVYLPQADGDERLVAEKIDVLLGAGDLCVSGEPQTESLAEDQVEAITQAVQSPVFILTGAPGTGKTYTIQRILDTFKGRKVELAAPTGKAAKRIEEQTGARAQTVHRLLGPIPGGIEVTVQNCSACGHRWEPPTGRPADFCERCEAGEESISTSTRPSSGTDTGSGWSFKHHHFCPLDVDVLVIDEVSMVDNWLMARLLDAVKPGTRLILVGDTYQLPSVGAGNILRDLIDSGRVPAVELAIIKRQNPGRIVNNCHRIKAGRSLDVLNEPGSDFFFIHRLDTEQIRSMIVDLAAERLPSGYGADPLREVQVISPTRERSPLSCLALNRVLQDRLNPGEPIAKSSPFRIGDKVIQTKNDYDLGILNGDVGFVVGTSKVRGGGDRIVVDFPDYTAPVEIPIRGNRLELAYALTCHKYQGSEARIIIIPIHRSFGVAVTQRNWIYTAVSRAREVCVLVGDPNEATAMLRRVDQQRRFTGLADRLRGKAVAL